MSKQEAIISSEENRKTPYNEEKQDISFNETQIPQKTIIKQRCKDAHLTSINPQPFSIESVLKPKLHTNTLENWRTAQAKVFESMRKNPYRPKGLLKVPFYVWKSIRSMPYRTVTASDGLPIPPNRHIYSVAGVPNAEFYLKSGSIEAKTMINILKKNDLDIRSFESILDFGCGCGRIIRHLKFLKSDLHGTDYNPKLIQWCKLHLPFATFKTNQLMPPLNYDDEEFDFIYAYSVFTHLDEQQQLSWRNEILRVLKPDGILLMTTHGEAYLNWLTLKEKDRFQKGQLITQGHGRSGSNSIGSVQSLKHVQTTLAKGLEIIDYIPSRSGQDTYVMKKCSRDVDGPVIVFQSAN